MLLSNLDALLKRNFVILFGASLTSRVIAILSFMPFTIGEQAVVVRKYMLKLTNTIHQPIDTKFKKFVDNTHVKYVNDGQIALHIGKQYYILKIEARSLDTTMNTHIKYRLIRAI